MPFAPRRNKDLIEEMLFAPNWNLFSELELVFFDTTLSILRVRVDRHWDKEVEYRPSSGFESDGGWGPDR